MVYQVPSNVQFLFGKKPFALAFEVTGHYHGTGCLETSVRRWQPYTCFFKKTISF